MVIWEDCVIHFFYCASSSSGVLKSTLNDTAFSKCSDIFTLHVCNLCSNSSDEFQFQAFSHFLPGLHPEVK